MHEKSFSFTAENAESAENYKVKTRNKTFGIERVKDNLPKNDFYLLLCVLCDLCGEKYYFPFGVANSPSG
jgi:formylmethanofuran dehydrogenase subunit E